MGSRLDDLLNKGVSHVASFIPWQAVEADISHTLTRFLTAIIDRNMTLSLILTPEVGVHYPNSGVPKDVISRADNIAQHALKGPVTINMPPNSFNLPSLLAPELGKRYYGFLARMDAMLAEFSRTTGKPLKGVTLYLTGSFWKYYRAPQASAKSPFGGAAGDFSGSTSVDYRQRVEYYFSQPEFCDPTPAAANRWKARNMEELNRRWFYQQSEAVFRNRTFQQVRRKSAAIPVREIELFTPEADPGLAYSAFLQMVSGGAGDFPRLSSLTDEFATLSSMGSVSPTAPFIHWSSFGSFRTLTDPEKQFLVLKSILLYASQMVAPAGNAPAPSAGALPAGASSGSALGGASAAPSAYPPTGGILIDEDEWFALSPSFRARAENLARSIAQGDLRMRTQAIYFMSHLWSDPGTLWNELAQRLGGGAKRMASLDLVLKDREAKILFVDPAVILNSETVMKLVQWARTGRIVVFPRNPNYTTRAKSELELIAAGTRKIEIDLGVAYQIHLLGDGNLVIYDAPGTAAKEGMAAAANPNAALKATAGWHTFLTAMLSLAEIKPHCKLSDSRLSAIPLEKRGHGTGLFVLNGSRRQITADIVFPTEVQVSDLATSLAAVNDQGEGPLARRPQLDTTPESEAVPASRFALDVPPCGVLPLAIHGLGMIDDRDKVTAAMLADETRAAPLTSASGELPGLDVDKRLEELWS